ncbi:MULTISPECIES: YggS family pyridoxal phosphate-dependent enzyme [unclassified Corynebacterium]|uniref:YggS family pyridoxal phosphate-dependent enzyme n=1 Tax=unclassified Corynebacterium TaxID=2624378 RepID=UPI0029CA9700|nr:MULTISPECIES: YggS family pyridoxal phosphate-dependent enzyme [unclassified Corynebacterium]WPF65436.1 YggS family pyridoxal phosphate-dependent enzyme [Corynebacterium sp. 22KM0430]WPF67932.1 YggS family pyridoxal phosphate-dependent enzyme [Corynebacterium sp. 21KM1197]
MRERSEELQQNLRRVRERITRAVEAAGRTPEDITLLPVTKFHPASDIALLAELGVREVGENREQEARAKAEELPSVQFHMIGQVQTKKANSVARWATSVHSVDSLKLVAALDRGAGRALERGERARPLDCFVQWSADGDTQRGGATEVGPLIDALVAAEHLRPAGIMCVPPVGSDPAEVFARAQRLRAEQQERLGSGLLLSAGMSGDMSEAIAAGTDIVRVGTGIMGARPLA